jgi:signal transduction histidine kinase
MQNLLTNAAKFRAEGRQPEVSVSALKFGDRWTIQVADNGIGIPEDQRERIFEPMVRLDKRIDGVGIGLATTKRVVESHHGAIGASANPAGQGSVFWVELPA